MASSSSTTQTTLNREQLFRQTNRILNANWSNSLHFITISLLFLPFVFSATAAAQFYFSGSNLIIDFDPFNLRLIKTIITVLNFKTLATVLAFIIFVILPTVAGIALITYSTNQVIHCKPLTYSSTFKSLSNSYIPLFFTIIAGSVKLIIIFLLFTISPIAVIQAIEALGFHFDLYISIIPNLIASYLLLFTILFFIVIWGSAAAIAVLESKSGFEPLRQSANQSAEFRSHSFSIIFIVGFVFGSVVSYTSVVQNIGSATNLFLILQIGVIYLQSSMMILLYTVANTVLYVQCKVARDKEMAETSAESEVSGEYVKMIVNEEDDEVSYELAKDEVYGGFTFMIYFSIVVWSITWILPIYTRIL